MKRLQLQIHSIVDLITNSSTELFVCGTEKTIETVKEILTELWEVVKLNLSDGKYPIDSELKDVLVVRKPTEEELAGGGEYAYGYESSLTENTIIIESAFDNSFPYDLFELVEGLFDAKRHHLG